MATALLLPPLKRSLIGSSKIVSLRRDITTAVDSDEKCP